MRPTGILPLESGIGRRVVEKKKTNGNQSRPQDNRSGAHPSRLTAPG